jgi:hypothetical protein
MVSSTLIQIFIKGPIETVLYGNPQITFFKSVYKRPTNFASQYVTNTPFTKAEWGKTITFKVPREADLLGGVNLRIKLSDLIRKNVYIFPGSVHGAIANTGPGWNLGTISADQNLINDVVQGYINDAGLSNVPLNLTDSSSYTYNPRFTSYCNGIGCVMIDYVSLTIGNKELERISGEWIMLNNELTNQGNSKKMFYNSVYFNESYTLAEDNIKNMDLMIPIPFFFTKDSGSFLPIMAINNETIEITVKLKELNECITHKFQTVEDKYNVSGLNGYFWFSTPTGEQGDPNSIPPINEGYNRQPLNPINSGEAFTEEVISTIEEFEIIYNFYHVGLEEQTYFLSKKHNYVVPIIKELPFTKFSYTSTGKTQEIPLELRNPVKFLVFYLQREDNLNNRDYYNMTYDDVITTSDSTNIPTASINSHLLDRFNLSVDSIDLLDRIPGKIMNNMELMTKFKNNTTHLIYVYSFAMFPNELQPSGTLNFSHFKNQYIKLNLCDPNKFNNKNIIFKGYYSSYNILTIEDGLTGFRYV